MAFKITQCVVPLIHQNKQNILQVFNYSTRKNKHSSLLEDKRKFNGKGNTSFLNFSNSCNNEESKYGENLAAVLHGVEDLRIEKIPVPKISPNQVLLQMEVVGICGSDIHFYADGKIADMVVNKPIVTGHEASGTVLECGECVEHLKPGDKVAVEPLIPCMKCNYCKTGNYHLCERQYFCSLPPDDGNLCRYYAHDASFCHKIPCHLDYEHATLIEPLAVAVHACKRAQVTSGDSILILGAGPIGLTSLLASRAYGASSIIILDIEEFKLRKAMELGADCALNIKGLTEDEIVKKIKELMGDKPNKTIECCGFQEALRIGFKATKTGGKMVLVGLGQDNMCLPVSDVIFRELDVLGAMKYVNDYPTAIDMVSNGKFDIKPIVTHHFKLEDAPKAFKMAKDKKEKYIKILIHPNPKWQPSC